jgi:hypothetical protein
MGRFLSHLKLLLLLMVFVLTVKFNYPRVFADLRMTFRQYFFLQDWFRNKLGVGLG